MRESENPSNRAIGLMFAAIAGAAFGYFELTGRAHARVFLAVGALLVAVAIFTPNLLAPVNRVWMALARLLHKVVSPVVLAVMYFAVVTPYGFVMRLTGYDPMKRGFDTSRPSYWIERAPPGPSPDSMNKPF